MAIVTDVGHCNRARAWFKEKDIYFGLGHEEEWPDESNPPIPKLTDILETPICYKKVEQKVFVMPDDSGSIFYRGNKYRVLTEEEAIEEKCRYVFCASWLNYDEAPVNVSYRQIALITGLQKKESVPDAQYILYPTDVENLGDTEVLSNDTPTYRSATKRERIAILVEF